MVPRWEIDAHIVHGHRAEVQAGAHGGGPTGAQIAGLLWVRLFEGVPGALPDSGPKAVGGPVPEPPKGSTQ
jgi:hypothetical protein